MRLFLALLAVSCHAFQLNHVSLRNTANSMHRSQITSLKCMSEKPHSSLSLRRDAFMKLMVGSTSAAVISTIWSSFPESVSAYSETKEELLSAANYIVKVFDAHHWILDAIPLTDCRTAVFIGNRCPASVS
jgi:hypothetical protein